MEKRKRDFQVSVVVTVRNEAATIGRLLVALEKQSRKPDEVILVDGGSSDKTVQKIKDFSGELSVRTIAIGRVNRAKGRNIGIKAATSDVIVVTDGGCTPQPKWLQRLIRPLIQERVDAVAGYYQVRTKSAWQQAVAPFVAVLPERFNPETFLPSSRSLAFTKKTWKEIGGYNEQMDNCEDLDFASKLKKTGGMVVEPEAKVEWELAGNFKEFFWQIFGYALGDMEGWYWPHVVKIATIFGRYVLFYFYPVLFLGYIVLFPLAKHWRGVSKPKAWLYLPLVQFVADGGVMSGALSGMFIWFRRKLAW